MTALPVLLYHSVDDDPPAWIAPFTVGPRTFAAQLDAIVRSGRMPVTAGEVVTALRGGEPLPPRAVAVTFDDGFLDFERNALPALTERALPATLFVTTGALAPFNRSVLPNAAMMSLDQVAGLPRTGLTIGAHTHFHQQLDTLDRAAVTRELTRPKRILEDALGQEVDLFAYPHGFCDARVMALTREAGYRGAFAVRNAFSREGDDPFRVARLTVRADTTGTQFQSWLDGVGAPTARPRENPRTVVSRFYRRRRAAVRSLTGS
ncbi:MAG TPA: polysaccharide deacetylase family protein [Actinocrinis sp.]|nr:polysaccharide deacetylase family protein [Actinocrinis sp.]